MMSYEVRMSDSVVNTGLDCQYFADRDEADQAAKAVNAMYPHARAGVWEAREAPTLTLAEWQAAGW